MSGSFRPGNPAAFIPAIKQIAMSVEKQYKNRKKAKDEIGNSYSSDIEAILAWCQKYDQP
jgi:hypothetical protein